MVTGEARRNSYYGQAETSGDTEMVWDGGMIVAWQ